MNFQVFLYHDRGHWQVARAQSVILDTLDVYYYIVYMDPTLVKERFELSHSVSGRDAVKVQ